MRLAGVEPLQQVEQDALDAVHVEDAALRVEHLDEPAHVRPLVMMRQIDRQRNVRDRALRRVRLVPNLDRVTEILHPDPVNRDPPVVALTLRIPQARHRSRLLAPFFFRDSQHLPLYHGMLRRAKPGLCLNTGPALR